MSHQSDPTPQTPSPAALQIPAPVTLPATAHQNKWTKSRKKSQCSTITTDSWSQTYKTFYGVMLPYTNQGKRMYQCSIYHVRR